MKTPDEKRLELLAKRLLRTPHKPRDESKISNSKAKIAKSPKGTKKPSR